MTFIYFLILIYKNLPKALLFVNKIFSPGDEGGESAFTVDAIGRCDRLQSSQDLFPIQSSECDLGVWAHVDEALISSGIFTVDLRMKPCFVHMHQRHLVLSQAPDVVETFPQLRNEI